MQAFDKHKKQQIRVPITPSQQQAKKENGNIKTLREKIEEDDDGPVTWTWQKQQEQQRQFELQKHMRANQR